MKPLYVKKNGVVYKISGNGMPASYPAENVEYDNTITSELQATDVQSAIDELSTRQGGVQSDWDEDDNTELDYIKNKPQNLVQDASYVHTDNNYDATAKGKVDSLGTASTKDAGVANGVAELDAAGKVPSSQLPSFVDDVIEVADYDHLPITGESGKIYVTLDTNKTYRWTGSGYAEISESLALGETSSTAYRGDRGKTAYDHATETKLSTATASGLYKVAATAQGHISSLTAVTKEDITGLGIPGSDTNTTYTFAGGTNKITVTPSGGTAQDVNITASDSTKVAKAGDSMTGTLCINSASSGSFTEGLRINAGNGGYSTLLIGGTANSTSGTSAGAFWIGTNSTNASYKRKLYIGQNGSTQSTTYFGTDADGTITPYLNLGSSGAVANGDTKAVTGGVVYNYAYPKADVGKSTMAVGKESSRSTATVGTWTAMCNSSQTGSPTLPVAGKWWNVVSLNNWTDSSTNWVSQLAVATQDTLNGVWWRTNDSAGTSINNSTWHQVADGSKIGWARYGTTSSTSKIKINIKPTAGWMLSFAVTIYQSYVARKFMISGYQYGGNHWYSPAAVLLGSSNNTSASVYFGYDSNNNLWVGFDGGNYTGVVISDVCNGYTQLSELGDMFTITNVSSLTTLQTTIAAGKPDAATVNGLTFSLVT